MSLSLNVPTAVAIVMIVSVFALLSPFYCEHADCTLHHRIVATASATGTHHVRASACTMLHYGGCVYHHKVVDIRYTRVQRGKDREKRMDMVGSKREGTRL